MTGQPAANPAALDLKLVADLAQKAKEPTILILKQGGAIGAHAPAEVPVLFDPQNGFRDVASYFESRATRPHAKKGYAKTHTLSSFIALTNRHKKPESAVFADTDWTKPGFTAVIDYHAEGADGLPAFGKHRISYAFPLSEEWKAWVGQNGKPMDQGGFAAWIEDRIAELASPTTAEKNQLEATFSTTVATPAQLITLSRGLQVNVDSTVKNAQTLASGEASISSRRRTGTRTASR